MMENSLSDGNEITVQSFDINNHLSNLRNSLEELCNTSLEDYSIWLQGTRQLSEDKSLVDHGIEGEGDVQVKLQIKVDENGTKMMNIIDVLKLEKEEVDDFVEQADDDEIEEFFYDFGETSGIDKRVQWIEAKDFVDQKKIYNIPTNAHEWSTDDVKHWLRWAIKTFDLKNINFDNWNVNGEYIYRMTKDNFVDKVPEDINNDFWTHILVLQTCGQVMVKADKVYTSVDSKDLPKKKLCSTVNLWKFLLELLTDKAYKDIVRWVDDNGEFQMIKPDTVARLWGKKKQKNNMTYNKLARALRYYSEGDLISKVPGKRFVYKFHFDIKEIVGYSPMQLNKLINDE